MKSIINNAASVALLASIATAQRPASSASCLPVATVENFNVTEYASAPWYVQQQAVNAYTPIDQNRCVTAQYSIRNDTGLHWWERSWWGYTVDVFNYAETSDGETQEGNLCADFDEETPSQLTVAPCFLPQLFGGPYWVVSYREGDEDGYALVSGGQPKNIVEGENNCGAQGSDQCCKTGDGINRSGLWILTRQRNPTEDLVNEVRTIANELGFSTSVLFDVTHDSECQVPGIDDDENSNESNRVRFLRHGTN